MRIIDVVLVFIAIIGISFFVDLSPHSLSFPDDIDWEVDTACVEIELPSWCMIGTDSTCEACGKYMLKILETHEYPCIYITNDGWIPTSKNPVDLQWAKILAQGY